MHCFSTNSQKAQNSDIEKGIIENSLKKTFSPEFLNRVDEIVVFNSLDKDDIRKIVDIEISKLVDRVTNLGYLISITEKAKTGPDMALVEGVIPNNIISNVKYSGFIVKYEN